MTHTIAFLIDSLGMGGAERMMLPLLTHLRGGEFFPRVAVFQVRWGNPLATELSAHGIPVDVLPIRRLREASALPRLTRYLRGMGASLVHTQLEFANTLGNPAAKICGLPSICTLHTLPLQEGRWKSRLHQAVEFWSLRHFCDTVIAVSEEARRQYLAVGKIPAERAVTIYNGIDLKPFALENAERESVRRELELPEDAEVLITLAVLREPKGIQYMIRALPAVLAARPTTWYLIAGDGAYRPALEEETRRAGVSERVRFAGMRTDVPRLLAAADLFVLPSLTEALPTVLAEAMAARLPILASAVGGIPEMVTDGWNGRLVPPAQPERLAAACLELLSQPGLRAEMGERGARLAGEQFNIEKQIERLKFLYQSLIRRRIQRKRP